jgi:predicted membrane-bound spermidine synthase
MMASTHGETLSVQRTITGDPGTPETLSGLRLVLAGLIFCVSGVAALIYQIAWQRLLVFHSGVGIYSVAIIIGAFLAGLGLGSYLGGVLSGRISPRMAWFAFASLELCVALFALASCHLYYDVLYLKLPWLFTSLWSAGPVHFLALLFPTVLMGMSLPFVVRATVSNPLTASRTVGYLYGINVLGAALGALLAPWVLIRLLGIEGAVLVGAGGNFFVGLTALALALTSRPAATGPPAPALPTDVEPAGSRPFVLWLALYTSSGFCALSLEILWFRLIDVGVKSNAFTFGTVLAIYLFGLGAGSMVGGPLAIRLRRPLQAFLQCQCVLLLYSGLALLLMVSVPGDLPIYKDLFEYWKQYDEFQFGSDWNWQLILLLYLVLPVFLYGLPTFLMGLSFAILQRAVHDDLRTAGRKVGFLQTGNILGNVAGSLLTGLLFLSLFGAAGTFKLMMAIGVAFALLGVRYYGLKTGFSVLAFALLALLLILPKGDVVWLRLHGLSGGAALFNEDASGLAAITPDKPKLRVSINGIVQTTLPFGEIHSRLGAIPAVVHPAPKDVAIIGLGSADTAWAASCRQETERIDVFEIVTPLERLLKRVSSQSLSKFQDITSGSREEGVKADWRLLDGIDLRSLLRLQNFLVDPRVSIINADGRRAIAMNERKYDLIEADALRPHSAYSGNVYSLEFFQMCSQKLKPGGVMCTWAPTPRIYHTFTAVFPYVMEFEKGVILVGSNEPFKYRMQDLISRITSRRVQGHLGSRIIEDTFISLKNARVATPARSQHIRVNRDLRPLDEFRSPYLMKLPDK